MGFVGGVAVTLGVGLYVSYASVLGWTWEAIRAQRRYIITDAPRSVHYVSNNGQYEVVIEVDRAYVVRGPPEDYDGGAKDLFEQHMQATIDVPLCMSCYSQDIFVPNVGQQH